MELIHERIIAGVAVMETGNAAYDLVQFSNIC